MGRVTDRLRYIALLIAGAFAAHELRFVAGYGHDAGRVLSEPGHEYLPFAAAVALMLLGAAAGQFTLSAVRGRRAASPPTFTRLWLSSSAALVAIYCTQESLEGAFAPGHPVWSHGGWTVVPIALAIGALVAALMHGASHALTLIAGARRRARMRRTPVLGRRLPSPTPVQRAGVIARNLAGRAPPVPAR
jgi:hypothetical protein